MERSLQLLVTSQQLGPRKETLLPPLEFSFRRNTPNTCQIHMIEQKSSEERRSRIIRQNSKKEEHGDLCIMEVKLSIRLRRPMELNLNSLRRRSQESHSHKLNTQGLLNLLILSRKERLEVKRSPNSQIGVLRSSLNRRLSSLLLRMIKENSSQPIMV